MGVSLAQSTPATLGEQFQINTYTIDPQMFPKASRGSGGEFVVVWQGSGAGSGPDTSGSSIERQHFSSDGVPIGNQLQVNTYTTGGQINPEIAHFPGGNFVIVWSSQGSAGGPSLPLDTSSTSIQGQLFDSHGLRIGPQFQVNSYTTDYQRFPAVATFSQGGFVVVWHGRGISGDEIFGQLFDSSGTRTGNEFQINTSTVFAQVYPKVAVSSADEFVVVWEDSQSGGRGIEDSQGQRFANDGTKLGGEFLVNTYTVGGQRHPDIVFLPNDEFLVVWYGDGASGSDLLDFSIQGQRFSSDGTKIDEAFQVNTYSTGAQFMPSVAANSHGDFIVTWHSYGSSGSDSELGSIQGQRFRHDGLKLGDEFQVNSYTSSYQINAAVEFFQDNNFIVAWQSNGSAETDTLQTSIQGQVFISDQVDLSVSQVDSVDPVVAGESLSYTVTVTNSGPSDAQSVQVDNDLPVGVTLLSTSGCAEDPIGVPFCSLGTLLSGMQAQYDITVAVGSDVTEFVVNQVEVISSIYDTDASNDSNSETTAVTTIADLFISKDDLSDPITAGSKVAYSITVTNNGPSDALGVVVTESLPSGLTVSLTNGCSEDPLADPECTLGTIPAGTQSTYVVLALAASELGGFVSNQVLVSAATAEGVPGDEMASESTLILSQALIFADGFEIGDFSLWSGLFTRSTLGTTEAYHSAEEELNGLVEEK